eukprot:936431-Pelagomonas_calceolata.AAC.3
MPSNRPANKKADTFVAYHDENKVVEAEPYVGVSERHVIPRHNVNIRAKPCQHACKLNPCSIYQAMDANLKQKEEMQCRDAEHKKRDNVLDASLLAKSIHTPYANKGTKKRANPPMYPDPTIATRRGREGRSSMSSLVEQNSDPGILSTVGFVPVAISTLDAWVFEEGRTHL